MKSGAGNAPGFQKRRNAVAGHDQNKRDKNGEPYGSQVGRVAGNFPSRGSRNHEKNKANHLVPEGMNGLYRRGKNMFDKRSRLLREGLTGHEFILSKI